MNKNINFTISALVINLDGSTDRLNFQKIQLQKVGITMERIRAVAVSDLSKDQYESLSNGWERKLRPAEVACFLSHKAAWQQVLDKQTPLLILEDDALLSKKTPELLSAIDQNTHNADLITLETRNRKKLLSKQYIPISTHFGLRQLYQDRTGAAAYILFPSGAKKLLNKSNECSTALADAFISSTYSLSSFQVIPAAAIQLDQCENYELPLQNPFASTITPADGVKPKPNSTIDYYRYKLRRIFSQLRMGFRQLSVLHQSKRMTVQVDKNDFTL